MPITIPGNYILDEYGLKIGVTLKVFGRHLIAQLGVVNIRNFIHTNWSLDSNASKSQFLFRTPWTTGGCTWPAVNFKLSTKNIRILDGASKGMWNYHNEQMTFFFFLQ